MAMSKRDRVIAEIDSGGEIAETARGPVEFQRRGEPPYILVLHGTPGDITRAFLPRTSSEKALAPSRHRGLAICARRSRPVLASMPPQMRVPRCSTPSTSKGLPVMPSRVAGRPALSSRRVTRTASMR